ncbi:flagellar motor switch phosphatase FliY [Clostridium algidicarnis]|uniref:flagellar motor switch phosphatase FliY n=1 Tax=Clostridium algidicarnis TaxID=37659 RepID=UPI001C0D6709|nr:flagellar motor switch phosphatase FliY [Clostridium algidicarnis]MBU3202941.1 flagellar motor switch phosphatase FliY [Clostridium algidicarnis]MBU3211095.1 flagellar motor switch phosphatase FliY [Clostridium algidicarnis]MBU3222397.1 flagellar motor switch phosphatase FliY [Clostridium algidicarnis]
MSNGFLSQEEIDALLKGDGENSEDSNENTNIEEEVLSDIDKDLLGEIGNISMGSASTTLSQIINQQVNITTPVVTLTTLRELKNSFEIPNIALQVKFTSGIIGQNLLVMKTPDASVISSLMMGGDGLNSAPELSEIEISAVSEAMNQMIASAATSMATMFSREVNISPPISKIWKDNTESLADDISEDEPIIKVSFSMTIGNLIDSTIMQILPVDTGKKIVKIMMGEEEKFTEEELSGNNNKVITEEAQETIKVNTNTNSERNGSYDTPSNSEIYEKSIEESAITMKQEEADVQKASFQPLEEQRVQGNVKNIDLILDVPLEISVVLGRTKKSIKDILSLGTGSLVELDKLAEEPVEILVNGKRVAYGEVVVVDENFGVRITSIVNNAERVKTLGR